MASASPDNIKEWKFPKGEFIQNLSGHNAIVNSLAANADNVLVSGGMFLLASFLFFSFIIQLFLADNGSLYFWDWKTGYNFQRLQTIPQPGSIDPEMGIYAMTFDQSGSRLITCEADKTIKIYKEDETAVS
jgi:pleiotropic regulator 1